MRIVIITQDDPFFLAESVAYLLDRLPDYAKVVGCVVATPSPYGKRETFGAKAVRTWRIFGCSFFVRYAFRYIRSRLTPSRRISHVLRRYGIGRIELTDSINSESSLERLRAARPDLLVSIAGNELFKKPLLELAPHGCLNLHTALLPKYRGLMPSFWVLRNRERETGVSVFRVDEGIDSGPILVQKRIPIGEMTQEELIRVTKRLGMDAILEAIDKINAGNVELIPNDDSAASYYGFPTGQDVRAFREAGARFY